MSSVGNLIELYSEFLEAFDKVDVSTINFNLEDFDYQGFDPWVTYQILNKAEPDVSKLMSDMSVLCAFIVKRGTNNAKAVKRMSANGIKRINALTKKYNIRATKNPGKNDVIMSRIPAVFPQITATLIANKKVESRVDVKTTIPKWLQFPQAPSIIPRDDSDTYGKWLEWAIGFDVVINGKMANETKVKSFGMIAHNSRLFSDKDRLTLTTKLQAIGATS